MLRIPLAPPAEMARREEQQQRLAELEKQLKATRDQALSGLCQAQLPQTAKYLTAAWDYQHPPADSPPCRSPTFAAARGCTPSPCSSWLDYLGGGDYRLMTKPIADVGGKAGRPRLARRGRIAPTSSSTTTTRKWSSRRSSCRRSRSRVHPGPNNGVAVGWRSPVTGTVRITGGVADADPTCGDGVAWAIDARQAGGRRELASGDFPNGGAQKFDQGKGAADLVAVEVEPGDGIELLVLPKGNYFCDTTVVDLTITLADGSKAWNLAGDVVGDPHQNGKGNPHADRFGNAGVWPFWDMADSRRGQRAADPALEAWDQGGGRRRIAPPWSRRPREFQKTFTLTDARSPFWIKTRRGRKGLAGRRADRVGPASERN